MTETQGYNLDSGTSCGFSKLTDMSNLAPLLSNGGPTQSMAVLKGSPAIDVWGTKTTGCLPKDQRGQKRPDETMDHGACDMGAYESKGIR
jgi:hypothetical protein